MDKRVSLICSIFLLVVLLVLWTLELSGQLPLSLRKEEKERREREDKVFQKEAKSKELNKELYEDHNNLNYDDYVHLESVDIMNKTNNNDKNSKIKWEESDLKMKEIEPVVVNKIKATDNDNDKNIKKDSTQTEELLHKGINGRKKRSVIRKPFVDPSAAELMQNEEMNIIAREDGDYYVDLEAPEARFKRQAFSSSTIPPPPGPLPTLPPSGGGGGNSESKGSGKKCNKLLKPGEKVIIWKPGNNGNFELNLPPCRPEPPEEEEPIPAILYEGNKNYDQACTPLPLVALEQSKGLNNSGGDYRAKDGEDTNAGLNRKREKINEITCSWKEGLACYVDSQEDELKILEILNDPSKDITGARPQGKCKCMAAFGGKESERLVLDVEVVKGDGKEKLKKCFIRAGLDERSDCYDGEVGFPLPSGDTYNKNEWNPVHLECTPGSVCRTSPEWIGKKCAPLKTHVLDPKTGTCSAKRTSKSAGAKLSNFQGTGTTRTTFVLGVVVSFYYYYLLFLQY